MGALLKPCVFRENSSGKLSTWVSADNRQGGYQYRTPDKELLCQNLARKNNRATFILATQKSQSSPAPEQSSVRD